MFIVLEVPGVVSSHANFLEYTTEWLTKLNRGGLLPVNDQTFLFLSTIEKLVQSLFPSRIARSKEDTSNGEIVETVMAHDHTLVQHQWTVLSLDMDDENDVLELL